MKKNFIIIKGYLNPYGSNVPDIVKLINEAMDNGYHPNTPLLHIVQNEYAQSMLLTSYVQAMGDE